MTMSKSTFVPNDSIPIVAWGSDELAKLMNELADMAERGEVHCVAMRLFKPDGTWEDVVVGARDEEERQAALHKLLNSYSA